MDKWFHKPERESAQLNQLQAKLQNFLSDLEKKISKKIPEGTGGVYVPKSQLVMTMVTLPQSLLALISKSPGLTDRELTRRLRGESAPQQAINQAARVLESKGLIVRRKRANSLIGNYCADRAEVSQLQNKPAKKNHDLQALSEDEIKQVLVDWLSESGWETTVAWGRTPGIDVEAVRSGERWVIEVKGPGSRPQMRVNYFLAILGETLQRMNNADARYSIALPDLPQYRGLWERLPGLAKSRTDISILFVTEDGKVEFTG